MFTGIITDIGTCVGRSSGQLTLGCSEAFAGTLKPGASVAVNGVCLTVTELDGTSFTADVMDETWKRTALGELAEDDEVNLELPMAADGRFEGHIVQGHVDGTGTVSSITESGNSHIFRIEAPAALTAYMIEKGSVTVNGISLTIIDAGAQSFSVGIIPHTFTSTMLHQAKAGDRVNIEVDPVAKYVLKFMKEQPYGTKN